MERWSNKVAVVTGASAGIGATLCKDLCSAGLIVVGLARRPERIEALRADLPPAAAARLHAHACDVSSDADIERAFAWIAANVGAIHVLVNNAGLIRMGTITGDDVGAAALRSTLETNLWGAVECTRVAVRAMKAAGVRGAHVFMINSIAGQRVNMFPGGQLMNVYPASKYGMLGLAEVLRYEFIGDGLQYKITSIHPGLVRTEIFEPEVFDQAECVIESADVSNAVLFALATPPNVQITELTIRPVGEMY